MKKYQVTFGYRAVITVDVKAKTEEEAKEKATDIMKKRRDKMYVAGKLEIQDDNFKPNGILDVDATWSMYDK